MSDTSEFQPPDADGTPAGEDMARIARDFMESLPHAKALNLSLLTLGPGAAEFALPYDAALVGDPDTGVLHGGAVSALLDTACGAAVIMHPEGTEGTATLDLRIDYMRAATPGQRLIARAECYHVTRNVAFARAVALDDDSDRPVASATGAFSFTARPRDGG